MLSVSACRWLTLYETVNDVIPATILYVLVLNHWPFRSSLSSSASPFASCLFRDMFLTFRCAFHVEISSLLLLLACFVCFYMVLDTDTLFSYPLLKNHSTYIRKQNFHREMELVPWTYNNPHNASSTHSDVRSFPLAGSSLKVLQDFSDEITVAQKHKVEISATFMTFFVKMNIFTIFSYFLG